MPRKVKQPTKSETIVRYPAEKHAKRFMALGTQRIHEIYHEAKRVLGSKEGFRRLVGQDKDNARKQLRHITVWAAAARKPVPANIMKKFSDILGQNATERFAEQTRREFYRPKELIELEKLEKNIPERLPANASKAKKIVSRYCFLSLLMNRRIPATLGDVIKKFISKDELAIIARDAHAHNAIQAAKFLIDYGK